MATSAQKVTSKHAPNLWSGKHNWQDGEIKSATVETGIPEGGTVEDSSQFQLKKTEVSTASTVFTKQKSPLFFWVNVWLLPKNTWNVVCFPCFFQYISFWIGWILGALLFGKKNTTHPAVSVVEIVSPLCVCQVLWVITSDLLDYFWNAKMRRVDEITWVE